jgi:hypothetical protein
MGMSGKVKFWSYFGAVVGIYGWFIGFTLVCLFSGQYALLGEVFVPGFLISGIMAVFLVLVLESVFQRFGFSSPMLQVGLWGVLLSEMGLLFFLLNTWLRTLLQKHPEMMRGANVQEVGGLLPNLLMGVGLALLVVLAVGFFCSRQEGVEDKA